MVNGGVARRPGLALAGCSWAAFAAMAAGPVHQAATQPGSVNHKILYASSGFGGVPSLCLLLAATLLVLELRADPEEAPAVPILSAVVLVSATLAVVMAGAGIVALPVWSTSTAASDWFTAVQPNLSAGAVAALAAVIAESTMDRAGEPSRAI